MDKQQIKLETNANIRWSHAQKCETLWKNGFIAEFSASFRMQDAKMYASIKLQAFSVAFRANRNITGSVVRLSIDRALFALVLGPGVKFLFICKFPC